MKKCVFALTAAVLMMCAAPAFAAQAADAQALKELNGAVWMESSQAEKLAFLLGVEMMIATEDYLAAQTAGLKPGRVGGAQMISVSPFMKGWLTVFKDTSRAQLADRLDACITANPDTRSRHVFEIIWREMLAPQMQQAKQTAAAKSRPWNY